MKITNSNDKALLKSALKAQKNAYSPYSGFKVGSALLDSKGNIFTGCNVENSSFGATVCAERSAISAMITAGSRSFTEISVVTNKGWFPCGICRQVMLEFAINPSKTLIHIYKGSKKISTNTLDKLIPSSFSKKNF